MSSNLDIFLMAFSVPIGGTIVTAVALCIFNRKWILKQFTQCCHKFCVCTTEEQSEPEESAIKITDNRWHINNHNHHEHHDHHNHFNELYHHHDLLEHHDETKV